MSETLTPGVWSLFVLCEDNTWLQPSYRLHEPIDEHTFRMTAEMECGGFISYGVCEDVDCPDEYVRDFPAPVKPPWS